MLGAFPLWAIGLLIMAACVVAVCAGIWLRRRHIASRPAGSSRKLSEAESYIIGSIFGLLAFFLAMTFTIALERYGERKELVYDEANAISTTYMRLALFDEPAASETRELMRQYTHTRIAPGGMWNRDAEKLLSASHAARERLWARIRLALLPLRQTDFASNILEPMNQAFDLGTKRELLSRTSIPARIFEMLLIYTLISAAMLGYVVGDSGRARQAAAILLVWLYTLAFVMILDLDRPQAGSIKVPQLALEELAASMDRDAAAARLATQNRDNESLGAPHRGWGG